VTVLHRRVRQPRPRWRGRPFQPWRGRPGWQPAAARPILRAMGEPSGPRADPSVLGRLVQAGVDEIRRTNALALAWLRLGLRVLTLAVYLRVVLAGPSPDGSTQGPAAVVNLLHLALGAAVLALLLRRRWVPWAILAGAASDFAAVSIGAWRASLGPFAEQSLAYYMGAFQMMLLFAALTLRTRVVAALSVFSVGYMAFLLTRLPAWDSGSWLILLTLTAFAFGATFAGTRMVGLASRSAAEAYGSGLLRRHADELGETNAALREARGRAELLTRLIVHDLRSPLTSVVTGLEVVEQAMARARERNDDAREALALSGREARRLAGMVSDLLAVGRLEEGMRAQRSDADVAGLVAEVARAHTAQAERAGVVLSVVAPAALRASIDAALARRLLENLVGNALRHLDAGDRLELAAEADGELLRLAVRNTGPAVPAALREKIFEKDVSGAGADWSHAGLGLHFCSLAAAAHGGRITLAERQGWNVSFEAELAEARPRIAAPRAIGA